MDSEIEVRLLGPLEVVVPDGGVEFEGAKQRRLFVALALRAPEAVSVDELVEAVWGDEAPGRPRAGAAEAGLASARPRRRAPAGAPARRRLRAGDRARGDRQPPLRGAARARAGRTRDPARPPGSSTSALALWRGPALADHRFDEFAQSEIARLEELRAGGDRGAARGRAGPRAAPPTWSASCARWSPSTRCASGCAGS